MIWNIVTDSSCDLHALPTRCGEAELRYTAIPFVINVGSKDFVDDDTLVIGEMLDAMEAEAKASHTACPSPAAWEEAFRAEGNVVAITISKELSGSYNSACAARDLVLETEPDKKIAIINSISAGAGLVVLVQKLCQCIEAGLPFDEAVKQTKNQRGISRTIFALCSFDNLVKNGRVPRLTGFVAKKLGFWGIGTASSIGTIQIEGKVRGAKRMLNAILEDMKAWGKPVKNAVITHCQNPEMAEELKRGMQELCAGIKVEIHDTKGLCSYYAERHGLIICYN